MFSSEGEESQGAFHLKITGELCLLGKEGTKRSSIPKYSAIISY